MCNCAQPEAVHTVPGRFSQGWQLNQGTRAGETMAFFFGLRSYVQHSFQPSTFSSKSPRQKQIMLFWGVLVYTNLYLNGGHIVSTVALTVIYWGETRHGFLRAHL